MSELSYVKMAARVRWSGGREDQYCEASGGQSSCCPLCWAGSPGMVSQPPALSLHPLDNVMRLHIQCGHHTSINFHYFVTSTSSNSMTHITTQTLNIYEHKKYFFRSNLIMTMVFMNRLAPVVSEVRINFHVKDHNWIVIESPVPPSVPVKQSNSD